MAVPSSALVAPVGRVGLLTSVERAEREAHQPSAFAPTVRAATDATTCRGHAHVSSVTKCQIPSIRRRRMVRGRVGVEPLPEA